MSLAARRDMLELIPPALSQGAQFDIDAPFDFAAAVAELTAASRDLLALQPQNEDRELEASRRDTEAQLLQQRTELEAVLAAIAHAPESSADAQAEELRGLIAQIDASIADVRYGSAQMVASVAMNLQTILGTTQSAAGQTQAMAALQMGVNFAEMTTEAIYAYLDRMNQQAGALFTSSYGFQNQIERAAAAAGVDLGDGPEALARTAAHGCGR